jgi:hypothetical protein
MGSEIQAASAQGGTARAPIREKKPKKIVVNARWFAYLLPEMRHCWCEGKPVLPSLDANV